jgi:hypothetical protein
MACPAALASRRGVADAPGDPEDRADEALFEGSSGQVAAACLVRVAGWARRAGAGVPAEAVGPAASVGWQGSGRGYPRGMVTARDGLAPGGGAQQAQAVEADDEGGALVA